MSLPTSPQPPVPAVVRRARREDIPAFSMVYVRSWQDAYRGLVSDAYLDSLTPDHWSNLYRKTFGAPDAPVVGVLELDGAIVGLASVAAAVNKETNPDLDGTWGEVVSLYLLPDVKGRGLGRALMDWAREELREMGFTRCAVWMMDGNRNALGFYRHLGFEPDGASHMMEIGGTPVRGIRLRGTVPAGGAL